MLKGHLEGIPAFFYNKFAVNISKYLFYTYEILLYDELRRAKTILDVGTGPGHLPYYISQTFSDIKVFAIDPSEQMIKEAKKLNKRNKNIVILKGSALCIPFKDETFDLVVSNFSIKHWEDIGAGLKEVFRVLKKGGTFFCIEVDKNSKDRMDHIFEITSFPYKFGVRYILKYFVRYTGVSADELNQLGVRFHGAKFLPIVYAKLSK